MNIKQEVKALLQSEGITPAQNGYSHTRYIDGMNALYRNRPDLCKGRAFVQARQCIIDNAKGKK